MDPLQEDEYWSGYNDANAQEASNEDYYADATQGRAKADSYFSLFLPQNIITAGSSAVHYNSSPYAYVLNNPLSYIDPLGLDTGKVVQLKEVHIVGNKSQDNGFLNSWWTRGVVYGGGVVSAPLPKKWLGVFVAENSSKATTVISATLGKWKRPIRFMGKRRLYTHTLNGSKRYASTWGKYLGRWGGKALGRLSLAYSVWDLSYNVSPLLADQIMEAYPNNASQQKEHEAHKKAWIDAGVCFKAGTLVIGNKDKIRIEKVKVGNKVASYNEVTKEIELSTVTRIHIRKVREIFELAIGKEIVWVTREHPFYVINKGWTKVGDLKIGDKIKTQYKNTARINDCKIHNEENIVYNIEVSKNHNYYISDSGILVHNKHIKPQKLQKIK